MDVALELLDVADVDRLVARGRGEDLHHADGAHVAALRLVEAGLLVGLGGHQHVVEPVLIPVLLEQIDHRHEALAVFVAARVLHPLGGLQVLVEEHVAGEGALLVGLDEGVDLGGELRAVLAEGPRERNRLTRDVRALGQAGEDLQVEIGHELVHHRCRNEPRVDHLQNVAVLEHLLGREDGDGRLACGLEARVEPPQVLGVAARKTDVDLLARQVLEAGHRGSGGAGDQHLPHAAHEGIREVHLLLPLGRDGELGGGDVALAGEQARNELVARHRDRDDVDRDDLLAELLVELLLEGLDRLVGDPDLAPLVDKVEDRVLHGQDPDDPPLEHAVEVATERLDEEGCDARRQRGRLRHLGGFRARLRRRGRVRALSLLPSSAAQDSGERRQRKKGTES